MSINNKYFQLKPLSFNKYFRMKKYIFVLYFVLKVVVQIQNLKHLITTITNRTFKLLSGLFANKFKENKRNATFFVDSLATPSELSIVPLDLLSTAR